jgi:predicted nicotinamide N-methyase
MQERPPVRVTSSKTSLKRCSVRWEGIHIAHTTKEDVEFGLDLSFREDCIEPLFSGGCWAGTVVWDASLLLSDYLIQHRDTLLTSRDTNDETKCPPRVVELGAGVGVPGMTAALLGAEVLLTEQDPLYSLLGRNVAMNKDSFQNGDSKVPSCDELDWNDAKLGRAALLHNWGCKVVNEEGMCGFALTLFVLVLLIDCSVSPLQLARFLDLLK